MTNARPPGSDSPSGAGAPEAASRAQAGEAGGLDAATVAAPATVLETAMVPAGVPEATAASADTPEMPEAAAGMSEATPAVAVPSGSAVSDFMIHLLARALRQRVRYRYVAPRVLREGESFRIQSPCCSRNVDPSGGLIDIALLTPDAAGASGAASTAGVSEADGMAGAGSRWSLSSRDHAAGVWRVRLQGEPLASVLDALCLDSERQFWP